MVKCPYCSKSINLSGKARRSIEGLKAGKWVRIKCPHCSNVVSLGQGFQVVKVTETSTVLRHQKIKKSSHSAPIMRTGDRGIQPPEPPDISWLKEGLSEEGEQVSDDGATLALVLVRQEQGLEIVVKAIEEMGYRVVIATSSQDALDKMEFGNYAMVAHHSRFEGYGVQDNIFYRHMQSMRMATRRYIFYFLIGPEFNSLYDLQALVASANLVVNEEDISSLDVILMKKIPEYERLFGKLIEEIRLQGKII